MRRDVCYFYPVSVDKLFNAYYTAATNAKFRREPNVEPYHTMSFGLNFSVKYNFNGGSCTLRFIPYQNGSAINLRFSIAQLYGARYEKYANDLSHDAAAVLGVAPQLVKIDVEHFLAPNNMVSATVQNAESSKPIVEVNEPKKENLCANCGKALEEGAKFCIYCGSAVAEKQNAKRFCTNCGAEAKEGAAFCMKCGNKL